MFVTLLEPDDVAASYQRPRRTRATLVLKRADSDTVIPTTLAPRAHAGANSLGYGTRARPSRTPWPGSALSRYQDEPGHSNGQRIPSLAGRPSGDCVCVAVDSRRHAACLRPGADRRQPTSGPAARCCFAAVSRQTKQRCRAAKIISNT